MNKYSYYDANGNIFSIKTLKDENEAELNLGKAVGFIKGSYQGHIYRIENGQAVINKTATDHYGSPTWPTKPT